MPVNVSFRVVGLYCYFENLKLETVSPTSTVKEVMDAIAIERPDFSYRSMTLPNGKELVKGMSYVYNPSSTRPYNSSLPKPGPRSEDIVLGPISLVWQYYRSVTVSDSDGKSFEVKTITPGYAQPSYAVTPLNQNACIPSGTEVGAYNLTWRLLKIEMQPENMKNYSLAVAGSI
ncbi:MAG: hypothetical protein AAGG01_10945 [Planctomycetota bacterium]